MGTHLIHVSYICSQIFCPIQFSIRPLHLDHLSLCRWTQLPAVSALFTNKGMFLKSVIKQLNFEISSKMLLTT